MSFLFRRVFWGFVLILIGVLFIINNIFNIDIPIWDIVWPAVLILIGLSFLTGRKNCCGGIHTKNDIIFDEGEIKVSPENREYNTIFGKSTYDFRKIKLGKDTIDIEANTVFGSTNILIDQSLPMRIEASSAFGGVRLPDGDTVAFGDRVYTTKAYKKGFPCIKVKVSAVFGGVEINS